MGYRPPKIVDRERRNKTGQEPRMVYNRKDQQGQKNKNREELNNTNDLKKPRKDIDPFSHTQKETRSSASSLYHETHNEAIPVSVLGCEGATAQENHTLWKLHTMGTKSAPHGFITIPLLSTKEQSLLTLRLATCG